MIRKCSCKLVLCDLRMHLMYVNVEGNAILKAKKGATEALGWNDRRD